MKKQLLAIGIIFALCVPMLGPIGATVSYAAPTNAKNEDVDQDEKALNDWEIDSQKVNAYQDIEDEEPPVIIRKHVMTINGVLSTSYDPRKEAGIPAVRNQGSLGTCWAHSAQSMIEMDLWRQGMLNEDDMSEFQTVYFMNHDWEDPLGLCTGDNFHRIAEGKFDPDWYKKGGNTSYTKYMLMDWVGAVSENEYPETAYSVLESKKAAAVLEDDYAINRDAVHVQGVYVINAEDSDTIKEMIKEHGAVGISYYHDGQTTATDGGGVQQLYYNAANKAYYYDGFSDTKDKKTNHAVAIVGWDDNFSRSNFNLGHQPTNDGAWLVRNSWGDSWGDKGYFWISYEDTSLADKAYAVWAVAKGSEDYYDHNYQYDGGISGYYIYYNDMSDGDGIQMANVFTAQSNEVLEAVAAYMSAGDTYEIEIYKDVKGSTSPTNGTLVHTQQGNLTEPMLEGYHTIKLDKKIELEEGDTFSVVVRLVNIKPENVRIYLDTAITTSTWMSSEVAVKSGESFYRYYSQSKNYGWTDASTRTEPGNVRVKAYTVLKRQSKVKEGATVSLRNAQLIEGQSLSSLTFDDVEFVDDNDKTLEGSLEFKDPEYKPEVGTITVEWVFTPDDIRYEQCTGTLPITVLSNKIDIENNDYETTYIYMDTIPEPAKDNFTISSPAALSDGGVDWTFEWKRSDGTKTTLPPSDAGEYTLIVTVKSKTDPRSGVLELPVTISKLTLTKNDFQVKLPGNGTIEYNGQPQKAEITCVKVKDLKDFTVKYQKDGLEVTEEAPTEPGTYTVMIDYNKNQSIMKIQDMIVGNFVITRKEEFEKPEDPTDPSKPTQDPVTPSEPTEDPKQVSLGTVLKDSSGASYKVTSANTVAYKKPVNKLVTKVTIPDTVTLNGKKYQVTSIENNAFSGYSKLKSVKIGKNVTSIGSKAFYKCKSLTSVTIPAKVKKIGKQAFANCKKLKNITIKTTQLTSKSVGKNAFKGIYKKPTVKVPKKKKKVYPKMLKAKGVPAKAKIK